MADGDHVLWHIGLWSLGEGRSKSAAPNQAALLCGPLFELHGEDLRGFNQAHRYVLKLLRRATSWMLKLVPCIGLGLRRS